MPVQDWNPPEFAAPPQKLIPANRVKVEGQPPEAKGTSVPKIIRQAAISADTPAAPARTSPLLRMSDFQLGDAFALPSPISRREEVAAPVETHPAKDIPVVPIVPPPPRITEASIREEEARKWEERLQLATSQAFEEGYRKGCIDTESALKAPLDEAEALFSQGLVSVQNALDSQIALLEPLAARFAIDLAERLLGIPLPEAARLPAIESLHELLQGVRTAAFRELYVHPTTHAGMEATGMSETLKAHFPDLRITSRGDLQPGDWILETPETAIRFLRKEVLDDFKRKLGLVHLSE